MKNQDLETNARVALFKDTTRKDFKHLLSITVIGKRWFDKVNGNTYCSSRVYFDGVEVLRVPWEYGYGSYYMQKATEVLRDKKMLTLKKGESLWMFCERKKIALNDQVFDGLKRDMVSWGADNG